MIETYRHPESLKQLIEQLKAERESRLGPTRTLESMIAKYSAIATKAPQARLRDLASRLRGAAIQLYADAGRQRSERVAKLLETSIEQLQLQCDDTYGVVRFVRRS